MKKGLFRDVTVHTGAMNYRRGLRITVVRSLLKACGSARDVPVMIDCPPGALSRYGEHQDADYCILVAEPTIFAFTPKQVYVLVKRFRKPYGVVLNKSLGGISCRRILREHHIPIIGKYSI